jgi:hypothetical protein
MICLSYYLLCLLFNKIREEFRTGSSWKQGLEGLDGEVAQTMNTYVSKCKNDKKRKKISCGILEKL